MQAYLVSTITLAAGGLVLAWVVNYYASKHSSRTDKMTGEVILEYPTALIVANVLLALLGILMALIPAIFIESKEPGDTYIIGALLLAFGGGGVALIVESICVKIYVSQQGIRARSPWQGNRFFAWEEVSKVSYHAISAWFVVYHASGDVIRVPITLAGLNHFEAAIKTHLPIGRTREAKEGFDIIHKGSHYL